MAGAAPAAAATSAEHTKNTLVWVRPAAAAAAAQHAGGAGKTANAADAEEWVKATVARVLDNGATLEVVLEGDGNDEESLTTIIVSAADAPLQNPTSRLGVEVRERERKGEKERRELRKNKKGKAGAPFFLFERWKRPPFVFLCLFPVPGARDEHAEALRRPERR